MPFGMRPSTQCKGAGCPVASTKAKLDTAASRNLWEAFEQASEQPVGRMMKSWIEQPGFPMISVKKEGGKLHLAQQRFSYLPADSDLTQYLSEHSTPQTKEQIATGREVGAEVAADLVEEIRGMGMPAERPTSETKPQITPVKKTTKKKTAKKKATKKKTAKKKTATKKKAAKKKTAKKKAE